MKSPPTNSMYHSPKKKAAHKHERLPDKPEAGHRNDSDREQAKSDQFKADCFRPWLCF